MNESEQLTWLLRPLKRQDPDILAEKVTELKRLDGESWAIGEMVERAVMLHKVMWSDYDDNYPPPYVGAAIIVGGKKVDS